MKLPEGASAAATYVLSKMRLRIFLSVVAGVFALKLLGAALPFADSLQEKIAIGWLGYAAFYFSIGRFIPF
jgi:hypothetical protein